MLIFIICIIILFTHVDRLNIRNISTRKNYYNDGGHGKRAYCYAELTVSLPIYGSSSVFIVPTYGGMAKLSRPRVAFVWYSRERSPIPLCSLTGPGADQQYLDRDQHVTTKSNSHVYRTIDRMTKRN